MLKTLASHQPNPGGPDALVPKLRSPLTKILNVPMRGAVLAGSEVARMKCRYVSTFESAALLEDRFEVLT